MQLTREERQFRILMRIWTVLFGIGAISFLVAGDWIILGGNWISKDILQLSSPSMPVPTERFWLSLTTSLMVTITIISYFIQKDVRTNLKLTIFLLVSKLTSTVVFLSAYFWDAPYFNYLLGSLFCDGPIFVITLVFYRRAFRFSTCNFSAKRGEVTPMGGYGGGESGFSPPFEPNDPALPVVRRTRGKS